MPIKPAYQRTSADIQDESLTREDFAPAAGMPVVRRGASTIGDGGSGRIRATWAPTATDYTMRVTAIHPEGAPPVLTYILGRDADQYDGLFTDADGDIIIRPSSTKLLTITGAFPTDGQPHEYELQREGTTLTARLDGKVIGVATSGSVVSTTPAPHYFTPATDNDVTVAWDGWLIDPNSDANTAYYALDTLDAAGKYANTYPNSTVADAFIQDTVLPVTIAATTPGSGVPVPVGPVEVMASRTTAQSFTANSTVTLSPDVDPYGWFTGAGIAPPLPGTGVWTATGRIRATVLGGSSVDVTVRLLEQGVSSFAPQELTLNALNEWKMFSITFARPKTVASNEVDVNVVAAFAGDTIEVDDVTLTLTLYPDLS